MALCLYERYSSDVKSLQHPAFTPPYYTSLFLPGQLNSFLNHPSTQPSYPSTVQYLTRNSG